MKVGSPSLRANTQRIDLWQISTLLFALLALVPLLAIAYLAFSPEENIWPHLLSTSLLRYVSNTLILMLGVGISIFLTGVSTAYVVSHYEFPLRRAFEWLLLLPLAVPAYVIAYLYTDLLEFAGPVQSALRELFGWKLASDYWFPEVRSMGGGILLMGLVLYPYVYLLARAAFLEQSPNLLEVSRLLGRNELRSFLTVSLPIARPAIAVGVALGLMETLNDFGTVDFFAIKTLTAGLYDVWLGMGNVGGAAQIALTMLTFVILLLSLEYFGRRKQRFYQSNARFKARDRKALNGKAKWMTMIVCLVPIVGGFVIPMFMLVKYAIIYFDRSWTADFQQYIFNSLFLSTMAAGIAVLIALIVAYSRRLHKTKLMLFASRFASLGYAVPGAVLAIGVIIPFAAFDNALDSFFREYLGFSTGLLLSGSVFAVIFAYVVRFMAVSIGSVESSFGKISESVDMASRTLGYSPVKALQRFHLPLLKGGLLTAGLVVFVDSMKELPATLILRPFNFETLATHVYQFASDEMIGESALGSLIIVLVGLLPVIVLSRTIERSASTRKL
ncbi:MAG: iron(III) transport system permease protein [Saprospiraceae bacterium]|jgi:iron(III) transport system permease protein